MSSIQNHPFVQTPSGQAVLDDSTYLVREWVANRAISSGIRALAHESYARDPARKAIELGADDARKVYALACQAAREADMDPVYKGALTSEGLPVGADTLGMYSASDQAKSLGGFWVKPTDYATAMALSFEDAPKSQCVPVTLSSAFRETLRDLLKSDAQRALAANPTLASEADAAAQRAESRFLRGGCQLRHGGYFPKPDRKVSDLSSTELARLSQQKLAARIGVAFGFGQVFGRNSHRHGAGWGPL
jgi:hypothetical protein